MAVAQVHQREIVEVPFTLPDGQILPHPALVISCDELQDIEPGSDIYEESLSGTDHSYSRRMAFFPFVSTVIFRDPHR